MSDPGGRVGTSRSYMMYMVRGNRGGAETDGRAEDPFEAAARGASASVPWKFFYLTLCLPPSPFLILRRVTDRATLLRLRNQAQKKSESALNPSPGATLQHRLNHPTAGEQKIFLSGFRERTSRSFRHSWGFDSYSRSFYARRIVFALMQPSRRKFLLSWISLENCKRLVIRVFGFLQLILALII